MAKFVALRVGRSGVKGARLCLNRMLHHECTYQNSESHGKSTSNHIEFSHLKLAREGCDAQVVLKRFGSRIGLCLCSCTGQASERLNSILGSIFGSKQVSRSVAQETSDSTGVSIDKIKQVLPQLASVAAAATQRGQLGQSTGGLGSILAGMES